MSRQTNMTGQHRGQPAHWADNGKQAVNKFEQLNKMGGEGVTWKENIAIIIPNYFPRNYFLRNNWNNKKLVCWWLVPESRPRQWLRAFHWQDTIGWLSLELCHKPWRVSSTSILLFDHHLSQPLRLTLGLRLTLELRLSWNQDLQRMSADESGWALLRSKPSAQPQPVKNHSALKSKVT